MSSGMIGAIAVGGGTGVIDSAGIGGMAGTVLMRGSPFSPSGQLQRVEAIIVSRTVALPRGTDLQDVFQGSGDPRHDQESSGDSELPVWRGAPTPVLGAMDDPRPHGFFHPNTR